MWGRLSFAIAFDYPSKLINNYTCGVVLLIRSCYSAIALVKGAMPTLVLSAAVVRAVRCHIFPLRVSHRYHAKKRTKGISLLAPLLL